MSEERRSREAVYDEEISPLVTKIIALCKEHDIPTVCDFALDDNRGDDGAEGLHCTTYICPDDAPDKTKRLRSAAEPRPAKWAAFIEHADDRREQVGGSDMPDAD